MAAEYMHIGIPVLNKKPNMVYNEWAASGSMRAWMPTTTRLNT